MLSAVLDLVFPRECISCGRKGHDLCLNCLKEAPEAERESAKWIYPLYDYRHVPTKKALHLLKYKGKRRLAGVFAEAIYGRIIEELADLTVMENFREPVLVPIPLSGKRRRERGFNQAELICRELIKIDKNVQHPMLNILGDVLVKPAETVHQAHIENRTERLKNIVGSFAVKNAEKIKGRNIILIDDITTTGATLSEAKKVLLAAGARAVIAFTVAH
jgi:competence protein ComFC